MNTVIKGESDVQVVGSGTIAMLKTMAEGAPNKSARMLLHESTDSTVQEMVIVFHRDGGFPPHKHPKGKCESYHIIEGEMDVRIYSDQGKCIQSIRLSEAGPARLYRIRGGIYHQPIAVTEWVVYHEVFTGPYNKERDVELLPRAA